MAFDPDVVATELILEPCIHPLRYRALVVAHGLCRIEFKFLSAARVVVVKQRAKLSRLGVETASNSFHPSM